MVYAQEHILLRFNGHFGATSSLAVDRWSVGVRLGQATLPTIYDGPKMQTLVNAAQAAAITLHTTSGVFAGLTCWLDNVSGATIGPSGKYSPATQLTSVSPTTATAGVGTATQPWNAALVCSLRTAIPRGRGSNGRLYWPALAPSLNTASGRFGGAAVTPRVTAFKTFLDALNTAANSYTAGTRVIVASKVGTGVNAPVTSIRSDDRMDSIERRENDTPSVWYTATLA